MKQLLFFVKSNTSFDSIFTERVARMGFQVFVFDDFIQCARFVNAGPFIILRNGSVNDEEGLQLWRRMSFKQRPFVLDYFPVSSSYLEAELVDSVISSIVKFRKGGNISRVQKLLGRLFKFASEAKK